jgi:hypothetical protein
VVTPGEEDIASIALLIPLSLMSSLLRINILEPKLLAGVSILAPLTMISSTSLAERSLIREIFIEIKIIINKENTFKEFFIQTSQKAIQTTNIFQ